MSSRNPTFYELFPIDSDHLGSDAMQMLCESDPPIRLVSIISNESKSKSSGMTHSLTHGENCDCDSSMEVSKDLMISRSYDVEDWYRSHFPTATGFTKEGGNICFSLIHGKCERHCLPLICASQVVLLVTSTKEKEDILAKILELAVLNDCVKLDENETTEKWKFATLIVLVEGLTQDDCDSILIPEPTKKGSKETKPNRQINQINEAFMFIHCISMTPSKETSNSPIEHVVDLIFANASDCLSWKDYQLTGSRLGSFLLKSLDQIRKSDRIVIQEVLEKMMTAEVQPILDQNEKNISSTAVRH